jgi:hypothetical protein
MIYFEGTIEASAKLFDSSYIYVEAYNWCSGAREGDRDRRPMTAIFLPCAIPSPVDY